MMISRLPADHPLHKLFAGLVEQVFETELGFCSPAMTNYLTEMLVEFTHIDQVFRLHSVDGATIREVSRMEAEAHLGVDLSGTQRRCLLNRYIGDYTLFWTGVYPEWLRPRHAAGASRFEEYLLQGRRSYGIASELASNGDRPPASLLRDLSEHFEFCVHGLRIVRSNWESLPNSGRN
ncbi:MAG: hypothetical protein JNG88_11725 [Phycisphaerales bacterium]|nr:hypothetical protein [Phycisphaerales bacterium]